MSRLRVAVIGVGHLGKEHARILAGLPDVELVGVADINREQAEAVAGRCQTRAFTEYWPLLNLVDAAVIAVPTTQHYAIARDFLRRRIALLIEKPMALDLQASEELLELAAAEDVTIQVGHIERFNPAFQELTAHALQPKFVACERLAPFSGRSTDIGVVLDLMIHDLDLLLALVGAPVESVEALGVSVFGGHEDVANARLVFASGCVATLTASRASMSAVRRMHVWAPEGYAGVDLAGRTLTFVQPSDELRRLRLVSAGSAGPLKKDLAAQHLDVLRLERKEGDALTAELRHFVDAVRNGTSPQVGAAEGCKAMAVAERVLHGIRNHVWTKTSAGPGGPLQLPAPLGPLFRPSRAAAA